MNPDNDSQLRQLFRQQREADAARTPSFQRVLRTPVTSPALVAPWIRWAAIATTVVVLGISVMFWRRAAHSPSVNTESWAALSNWQASSDTLLTMSSTPWGSKITSPSDSWFESSTQTTQKETL